MTLHTIVVLSHKTLMDDKMYAPTWKKRTSFSQKSLPDVHAGNFYLTSAFSGLYDSPSPFPYFERKQLRSTSPIAFVKKWFSIFRHMHRFRVQFDWNSREPIFESLVEYFPFAEPGKKQSMFTPFYKEFQGKKFNGTFLKCAEQLQAMESVIPHEAFSSVCEIGGGFGAMAEMVVKRHKPRFYCIIDIPETLTVSALYLSSVFPGKVYRYPEDTLPTDSTETVIILIQSHKYKKLRDIAANIGVFINGNSFAEMHPNIVQQYFTLIESYPGTYLSNTNPPRFEGEHLYAGPETYPYSPQWEFLLKRRQQQYYWRRNYQMISYLPENDRSHL